ncbi:MAG: hypothetical protein D8H97_15805 [Neisseria sp.]|nr:MAG: hypothetical protein D8H97_15805 [Neisseria sp.]
MGFQTAFSIGNACNQFGYGNDRNRRAELAESSGWRQTYLLCAFLIFTSFASNIKSAVCPYWIKAGPMNLAELVFNHNGIAVFSLLVAVLFRQWLGRYLWRHPFRKASLFLI